jgi:hypothetical protein
MIVPIPIDSYLALKIRQYPEVNPAKWTNFEAKYLVDFRVKYQSSEWNRIDEGVCITDSRFLNHSQRPKHKRYPLHWL